MQALALAHHLAASTASNSRVILPPTYSSLSSSWLEVNESIMVDSKQNLALKDAMGRGKYRHL